AGIGDTGKETLGSVIPRGARVVRRRRRLPFCATRRQTSLERWELVPAAAGLGPMGRGHLTAGQVGWRSARRPGRAQI
ncbi:MAG: hypothetical protein ACPIOQ_21810, partial [Promethearchaeia archaeon]